MKILSFGEIIWDVYPDKKCIGGAPLNFSAHAALLGADTAMLSAVGKDDLGASALDYLASFGVNTDFVKTNGKTTGICDVTVNSRGIPSYCVRTDTAYDNVSLDENDIKNINEKAFDLFYFGTLIQRESCSRSTLKRVLSECTFSEIFCDINLRVGCYDKESVMLCLTSATVLKVSDEEEPKLSELGIYEKTDGTPEAIAKTLAARFPNLKIIIVTLGAEGSYAYRTADGYSVRMAAIPVKVASTVGAGDSFSAAFAVSYLKGDTLDEAMCAGAELSAFVVSRTEAVPRKEG